MHRLQHVRRPVQPGIAESSVRRTRRWAKEYRRGWHPEKFTQARNHEDSVLIVGARTAGLESPSSSPGAVMQQIHIVHAAPRIGGALAWIAELPRLAEWDRLIDYPRTLIKKHKIRPSPTQS